MVDHWGFARPRRELRLGPAGVVGMEGVLAVGPGLTQVPALDRGLLGPAGVLALVAPLLGPAGVFGRVSGLSGPLGVLGLLLSGPSGDLGVLGLVAGPLGPARVLRLVVVVLVSGRSGVLVRGWRGVGPVRVLAAEPRVAAPWRGCGGGSLRRERAGGAV